MKFVKKGYGANRHTVLTFKKPSFKIHVDSRKYFNFINFLRSIDNHKFFILSCLWMCVIFYFSNQPASVSSGLSSGLNQTLNNIGLFNAMFKFIPIRKCAHFLLYFCLGIFVYLAMEEYYVLEFIHLKTVIVCFLYACTDEFHQFFISGRSAEFRDVLIDTSGVLISMFAIIAILLISAIIKAKMIKNKG